MSAAAVKLELVSERITARQLIDSRIRREVEAINQRSPMFGIIRHIQA